MTVPMLWTWAQMVTAGVIVVLPGYALLAPLRGRLGLDRVETLCAATGMSLALLPLLLYGATLVGLRFGPGPVLTLLGLAAVVAAITEVATARRGAGSSEPLDPATWRVYAGLGVVTSFVLVGRLWSVADLAYPLWTDSYAHTMITQLIVDHGAVPTSYAPYAPIPDFSYHFGFHTLAAWVHWLTGLPVPRSVVVAGQWVNILVAPTTYLFTARLFRDRRAGLIAAVIAGLLVPTPLQFVNWGRYTQLDGQMVLPVAAVLLMIALASPRPIWAATVTVGLAFAGLYLNHYRVFIFGVLLAAAYDVIYLWPGRGRTLRWGPVMLNGAMTGVAALVVTLPWSLRLWGGFGGNVAREATSGYDPARHGAYFDFVWRDLLNYGVPGWLLVLAAGAVVWGVATRQRAVWVLLTWVAAVLAGANLHRVDLTPLYPTGVAQIAFYLPAAAVVGAALARGLDWAATRGWGPRSVPAGVWLAGLTLVGAMSLPNQLKVVARDTGFVWAEDVPALAWVSAETPPDALFFIATMFWTPVVAHGLDAGYYLPLLAGRQTIMPPQHYASDGSPEYAALVNQRLADLDADRDDPVALWTTLRRYRITHIYIGARPTYLVAARFLEHPDLFELLYDQDDVYVFAVRAPAREGG